MTSPTLDPSREDIFRKALTDLRSGVCRCQKPKKPNESLCKACYYALPPALRKALYKPLRQGYVEAFNDASSFLDAMESTERAQRKSA